MILSYAWLLLFLLRQHFEPWYLIDTFGKWSVILHNPLSNLRAMFSCKKFRANDHELPTFLTAHKQLNQYISHVDLINYNNRLAPRSGKLEFSDLWSYNEWIECEKTLSTCHCMDSIFLCHSIQPSHTSRKFLVSINFFFKFARNYNINCSMLKKN